MSEIIKPIVLNETVQSIVDNISVQNTIFKNMTNNINKINNNIKINSWIDVQSIVKSGLAPQVFKIGDIFQSTILVDGIEYSNPIRVIGFNEEELKDETLQYSMTLEDVYISTGVRKTIDTDFSEVCAMFKSVIYRDKSPQTGLSKVYSLYMRSAPMSAASVYGSNADNYIDHAAYTYYKSIIKSDTATNTAQECRIKYDIKNHLQAVPYRLSTTTADNLYYTVKSDGSISTESYSNRYPEIYCIA